MNIETVPTDTAMPLMEYEPKPPREQDVVIVGSGFSGLGVASKLRTAGFSSFTILESAQDLGGAWRENTYPGCACDIPSPLYSYSFAQKPDWSRLFAPQPEILEYLRSFAERRHLDRHIRYGEQVDQAVWDESSGRWDVVTSTGSRYRSRYLIIAVGPLHHPSTPTIPGMDRFEGTIFHSAGWRHELPLQDKQVVVIGTGASAIQFVPAIVDQVGKVTVVQRTAPWILPKPDRPTTPRHRWLSRWFPPFRWYQRARLFWIHEQRAPGFIDRDANAMEKTSQLALSYLRREVRDDELRARLTPDYAIGCKRLLISSDWYKALQNPNAELVTGGVREVRERSVVTSDGTEVGADVIIFGTGFDAQGTIRIDVRGEGGRSLTEDWKDGKQAFLGTVVESYPNLFTMVGPNAALGHNSQIFMIEAQAGYVVDVLKKSRSRGASTVSVRPERQTHFNTWLQGRMAQTVWQSGGCHSYYQDSRSGQNTVLWPETSIAFWRRTRRARLSDYLIDGSPG